MPSLQKSIYLFILRLHPAAFRNEFARDMALDFEAALHTYGATRLFLDAAGSLFRQWSEPISSAPPVTAAPPSLLAGHYGMVRDPSFTPRELGLGLIASATQLALCLFALSAAPAHGRDLPIVSPSSSTRDPRANPTAPSPSSPADDGAMFQPLESPAANLAFARTAAPQTDPPRPELLLFHPTGPLPSYEVATIKPIDPGTAGTLVRLPPGGSLSPLSIRRYIMNAYGAIYAPQIAGGPDWINKDAYHIDARVPDGLESALQKMPRDRRLDQTRMLQQSLLAERFHLQAHFETRVLPVYELVAAKGGLRITAVPPPPESKPGDPPLHLHPGDPLPPGTMMTTPNSNGLRVFNARAISMQMLARVIGGDIGDRPIVDHTGFTGYFDVTDLTWAPLAGADASSEQDALSLAAALKDKLGLRIVATRDPIEVLVIDHIARPTPN